MEALLHTYVCVCDREKRTQTVEAYEGRTGGMQGRYLA